MTQVGSRSVPDWVAIVSLWSSLEGSILFWGLVMGAYIAGATYFLRDRHPEYMPYAAAVWLGCAAFFSFLLAGPAQPFLTVPHPPADGPGPNALLQNHVLMMIHPPFLYRGYVGMTIPFGLACAALLVGRLGHDFIRPLRHFLLLPWIFLTIAIVLGGWWAYEVLGWGGYWAWDPVENASFLPWLTATAALHSALLVERKGILKGWTATLVLATFLLTILGTFMTRSGVFNSVHSFTQSAIGPTILVFLAAGLVFSVVLLALRVDTLAAEGRLETRPHPRRHVPRAEPALRPLHLHRPARDRLPAGGGGAAGHADERGAALLRPDGGAARGGPALRHGRGPGAALGARHRGAGAERASSSARGGGRPVPARLRPRGAQRLDAAHPLLRRLHGPGHAARDVPARAPAHACAGRGRPCARSRRSQRRSGRRFGAYVVHSGAALIIVAIAVSSTMGTSKEMQLREGESATVGSYTLTFVKAEEVREPHRFSVRARIDVSRGGSSLTTLYPSMNQYETQREPIGTPAVRTSLKEDLYLSVMNIDPAQGSLGLLALVNPMVGWIWIATLVMATGGVIALLPSRASSSVPVTAAGRSPAMTSPAAAESGRP